MSKITVTLTAILNDGKTVRQPGEVVSLEEGRAKKLASLGMVKLQRAAKAKNGKRQTPLPPPLGDDQDDDQNGDPDGGDATDDQENGEE